MAFVIINYKEQIMTTKVSIMFDGGFFSNLSKPCKIMNNCSRPMIEAFMATYHRHEHLSVHYPLLNIFEVFEVGITSIQVLCHQPSRERATR